jgi:glycosyltransferase involved in cell wall biosynthesis
MKRILFVDHASRILGGAEVNLVELLTGAQDFQNAACACASDSPLCEALKRAGIRRFDHSFGTPLEELRVVNRSPSPASLLHGLASMHAAARDLETILHDFQPHAVISCTNKDHFAAGLACRRTGIPSLWWVNDAFVPDFFSFPVRFSFARAARLLACRLVAVSEFARRALLDNGLPGRQVVTIHNGIPAAQYSDRCGGHLRALLNLGNRARLVGLIGRFTPWKGQDFFLRLARKCALEMKDVHFVLIGQAFNEEQDYEASLRAHVHRRQLDARVHFVPFQSDLAASLADLDVLVHASLKPEPFGRVIIEAMAAGVPVLAAQAGGVPEIITHETNGLLAPPGDLDAYRDGLRRLLNGRGEAARYRAVARCTVEEHFTVERVRRQFRQLIEEVA